MTKFFSKFIFNILYFFDEIIKFLFNRSLLIWFKDFYEQKANQTILIKKKIVYLFAPNYLTNWLYRDFYKKEPETIEWIDNFKKKGKKIVFWDVGSNIGLYSIYAALKHKNIEIISFEPSTSNLRILSRNISLNKLQKKIKIIPIPLINIKKNFSLLREGKFGEGESNNSFKKINFEGKKFKELNSYSVLGASIDFLIEQKILEIPDYIKIDVDGLEHLILKGGIKSLKNQKIRKIQIEINESFQKQFKDIKKLMVLLGFKYKRKKRNESLEIYKEKKYKNIFNYYYER